MHDIVIRGGTLIDGTGTPGRKVSIAVDAGVITVIHNNVGAGREEIDATGLLVTPGWVDIHSHYDGQATWDQHLTPAPWNGVTTVVMGNCGVGFAPVKTGQQEFLIQLMEGVEDIPGSALAEGIQWNWESFPEYLDALDASNYAIDIGTQVPHGAVRAYVMGEDGANNTHATSEEISAMAKIVKEGLLAGALGFSTSRTMLHRAKNGQVVPGTHANAEEVLGLGRMLGEVGHGVFQMASDYIPEEKEFSWMKQLSRETGKRVLYSVVQSAGDPDQWRRLLRESEIDASEGGLLTPQIAPRPVGLLMGFESTVHPFMFHKNYMPLAALSLEERRSAIAKPEVRASILDEPFDYDRFDGVLAMITHGFEKMFALGEAPDYEPCPDQSLQARSQAENHSPQEIAYDIMAADNACGLIYLPMLGYVDNNLDATAELMRHPNSIYGLADGGAHCGVVSDASIPTFLLTHWARDRSRGDRIPIEELVHNQCCKTAQCYGLEDRGVIAVGMKADINVIDFQNLHIHAPKMVYDLPAQGKRFVQEITGYHTTICSGQVIYRQGKPTGNLPGKLIRGPQAAPQTNNEKQQ
ncbi:MAG: N-acyl-D-amino-acid deacylase [Oceanicoccus sp.]|jgi:N-acyl-D-amino-acid deacylase